MFAWYDRFTATLARVAAWLYLATGVMLVYEVLARYLFTAPTIWAEELSRLSLVWGTFVAAAWLLRTREHIRITLVTDRLPAVGRRACEIGALVFVVVLSLVTTWYGGGIAGESIARGSTTGSMLDLPMVVTEASVPIGFALLAIQGMFEIARLLAGEEPPGGAAEGH